jgi:hypothetical protein
MNVDVNRGPAVGIDRIKPRGRYHKTKHDTNYVYFSVLLYPC